MALTAPIEAIYPDPGTAFTAVQAHAKYQGYAIIKLDKKPSRVVFACDRMGKYNSKGKDLGLHKSRQRNGTGSKKCGCLMRVEIRLDTLSGQWILRVLEGAHNHGPSADPTAHPAHRTAAITPATRAEIGRLSLSGLTTSQILSTLRTSDSTIPLIGKDISNIIQANRAEELNGRTPIQWLLEVSVKLFIDLLY